MSRASRHRATQSLSVDASIRMRALDHPPSRGKPASLRAEQSFNNPTHLGKDADLACLCVHVDASIEFLSLHLCGMDSVDGARGPGEGQRHAVYRASESLGRV